MAAPCHPLPIRADFSRFTTFRSLWAERALCEITQLTPGTSMGDLASEHNGKCTYNRWTVGSLSWEPINNVKATEWAFELVGDWAQLQQEALVAVLPSGGCARVIEWAAINTCNRKRSCLTPNSDHGWYSITFRRETVHWRRQSIVFNIRTGSELAGVRWVREKMLIFSVMKVKVARDITKKISPGHSFRNTHRFTEVYRAPMGNRPTNNISHTMYK